MPRPQQCSPLRDFTSAELVELYAQHTAGTGQAFDPEALALAFHLTQGQLWRQHGEPLLAAAHYHEVAPHIVLMAFLQRVANAAARWSASTPSGPGGWTCACATGRTRWPWS